MRGRLGFYTIMCALLGWNVFNLFHYGGAIYKHSLVVGLVYTLLCLFGIGYCVWAMVAKYKRDNKRNCNSCEK